MHQVSQLVPLLSLSFELCRANLAVRILSYEIEKGLRAVYFVLESYYCLYARQPTDQETGLYRSHQCIRPVRWSHDFHFLFSLSWLITVSILFQGTRTIRALFRRFLSLLSPRTPDIWKKHKAESHNIAEHSSTNISVDSAFFHLGWIYGWNKKMSFLRFNLYFGTIKMNKFR